MTITIPSPPGYSSPYAAYSTSPLRSSPLSQPPITPGLKAKRCKSSSAGTAAGVPIPSRRRPSASTTHLTPSPSARTPPSPSALSATTPSPSSLSRSHPLLGSYQLSLLHSRMSQHAPHATDRFGLQLRAMGRGAGCPAALRAPAPISLPLAATYYDLAGGADEAAPKAAGAAAHTPWVADVDVEGWYFDHFGGAESSTAPPAFPGYRVAAVGQLQILVRTATAAVKVFVIPYDLRELDDGARLLARERTYVSQPEAASASTTPPEAASASTTPPRTRECLRYAVQLQFACATDSDGERGYYVARTIKLVFTASPPERDAAVRTERADEVVPAPARSPPTKKTHAQRSSFSRTSLGGANGRTKEDWALIRAKWLARVPAADAVRGFTPEPDTVRGFTPEPASRPTTPLAPLASPRSLLSALAPAEEREVRSRSRSPSVGSATSPDTPLDGARARLRAASPVTHRRRSLRVERELSERLRAMELGSSEPEHAPESLE
ncbi:uncharacterized protein LOC62_01G001018 [Vanrija pseudolonga]|uniref:Atos-like conserved domain-containing protein n=1 Tax=Vanrija pseudolonga TaxID=143232 RepID=A0AAF0Y0C2_9TREE|nr:hypothetical protein LOC62_01G001018 [Vanrija pseudolonga]